MAHRLWLGSKRALVNITGASTVTMGEQCQNLPFGDGQNCSGTDVNQLHFTGKQRDTESTNDYFGARFYASNIAGRFLTPDNQDPSDALPFVGIDATPFADSSNPQSLNLYSYVYNNPVSRTDSDGHDVNVCTTDSSGNQYCTLMSNEQYKAASQGNGSISVPTLDQVGSNGNGSGQFNPTAITDSNGNTIGTATYVSNGGADYYANRTGIDFINTQTAPVVNTMAGITIGAVGAMMGSEVAPAAAELSAAMRYQTALRAWKTLSAATGAAKLIGEFFKTGKVPPGLTPEMMSAYLNLAKTYLAAGMGTAGGIMQSGVGTQANRIQQLENYLGR